MSTATAMTAARSAAPGTLTRTATPAPAASRCAAANGSPWASWSGAWPTAPTATSTAAGVGG